MENRKMYTISVYTENNLGLLNRISGIFLRRHIDIISLNLSKSEIRSIMRFTIVLNTTEIWLIRIVKQIDKQLGVLKTFYHNDEETVFLNIALFKMKASSNFGKSDQDIFMTNFGCDVVEVTPTYVILSKQGKSEEIDELYDHLKPFGILQFVQSGRVSVSKDEMAVSQLFN